MSSTFFASSSERGINGAFLGYITDTFEGQDVAEVRAAIQRILEITTSADFTFTTAALAGENELVTNILALYYSGTTATNFGYSSQDLAQTALKQALMYYYEGLASASATPVNPIAEVLGVKCFSLRDMGDLAPRAFDAKIIRLHTILPGQFFTRMSASAPGLTVQVKRLSYYSIEQSRLGLVYQASTADNPFSIEVFHDPMILNLIRTSLCVNPNQAIDLGEGRRLIPLNKHLLEVIASLGDEKASIANAKLTFAAKLCEGGLTPFDAPAVAAASSHASGRDVAVYYGCLPTLSPK